MDVRLLCLLLVPLVSARWLESETDLPEHLQTVVRSADIEGYSLATVHASDHAAGVETGQSRRDIDAHASDPSSVKHTLSLHLTSGERLRMSLERRSVDTAGGNLTEVSEAGDVTVTPLGDSDCFFSGPVQGEGGFASLALCDGELMGSVSTEKRYYEVHALPKDFDERSADDVMRVLVTWAGAEHAHNGFMSADENMKRQVETLADRLGQDVEDGIEIPEQEEETEAWRRGVKDRRVTIEFADYLDSFYVSGIGKSHGLTSTADIAKHMKLKWSSAAKVLSDKNNAGWDISIRLVNLEIWRKNPSWYKTSPSDQPIKRMTAICQGTKSKNYDQVTVHTGWPIVPNGKYGVSWIGGLCKPAFRCAVILGANPNRNGKRSDTALDKRGKKKNGNKGKGSGKNSGKNDSSSKSNGSDSKSNGDDSGGARFKFHTELHEFGHSLGLPHDKAIGGCSPGGFMGGNTFHLDKCYAPILTRSFSNPKTSCIYN